MSQELVWVCSSCGMKRVVIGGPSAEPWGWWIVRKIPDLEDAMWRGVAGLSKEDPTLVFCSVECILTWAFKQQKRVSGPK